MRNDLYYPKAAKYFREKSNEELQHAERFIEYQNQRGGRFDISAVTVRYNFDAVAFFVPDPNFKRVDIL